MKQTVTGWSSSDELQFNRRLDTIIGVGVIASMCASTLLCVYQLLTFLDSFLDVIQ